MTSAETITLVAVIINCFLAVIGFFYGRGEISEKGAEWRGNVNGKLDSILRLTNRVDDLEDTVQEHEIAISKLKDSSKRAHERLDNYLDGRVDRRIG